jgi:hypothetical protein
MPDEDLLMFDVHSELGVYRTGEADSPVQIEIQEMLAGFSELHWSSLEFFKDPLSCAQCQREFAKKTC